MADHAGSDGRRMTILSAADVFAADLGRVRRGDAANPERLGPVAAIVEAADLEESASGPAEVNTGVYCFDGPWLAEMIGRVAPAPSGERYLPALAAMAADAGENVAALPIARADEAMGVNDRLQLAAAETALRDRINMPLDGRGSDHH